MIGEREKEFEDALFFGALATEQGAETGKSEVLSFAGLEFDFNNM
jgi:hypothetical protein